MKRRLRRMGLMLLALALCVGLAACGKSSAGDVQVLLDSAVWDGTPVPAEDDALKVIVTLDGRPLIELPFDARHRHTLTVRQPGVGENTVEITEEAVYMSHADCENQDCVNMGAVTRDNLELRVMGGFIVCLPHKLSVEVRGD